MGLSKQRMSLAGGRAGEGKQWSDKAGQSKQACRSVYSPQPRTGTTDPPLPERPVIPIDILKVSIQGPGLNVYKAPYTLSHSTYVWESHFHNVYGILVVISLQ